jgi:hypothetical protein
MTRQTAFHHFETAEIKTDENTILSGATGMDPRCSWCMDFLEPT